MSERSFSKGDIYRIPKGVTRSGKSITLGLFKCPERRPWVDNQFFYRNRNSIQSKDVLSVIKTSMNKFILWFEFEMPLLPCSYV